MKTFFAPAVALLNRLRFGAKFALMFVIVFVPLVVLGWLMLGTLDERINTLQNEVNGVAVLQALREPLDAVQQHRGLTALGGQSAASQLSGLRERADSGFNTLLTRLQALDASPELLVQARDAQARWANIRNSNAALAQRLDAHTELIAALVRLGEAAADDFEISLSAYLDTYYLGDALVNRLPSLTENMGQARALAVSSAASGMLDEASRIRLEVLVYNIQSYQDAMQRGLSGAFDVNAPLRGALASTMQAQQQGVEVMINLLRREVLDTDFISMSGAEMFAEASRSVATAYALFDAAAPLLEQTLAVKLREYQVVRLTDIVLVAAVLVVLAYLFVGLYVAIHSSVSRIREVASDVSSGNLARRVKIDTHDEMAEIGRQFNNIADHFERVIMTVSSASTQLASAAEELSSVSRHSAENIARQRSVSGFRLTGDDSEAA